MHVGGKDCSQDIKMPRYICEFDGSYEDAWLLLENCKKENKCPQSCEYTLVGKWTVNCQLVKVVDKAMSNGASALELVKLVSGKETCDCYKAKNYYYTKTKEDQFKIDKPIDIHDKNRTIADYENIK